MTTATEHTQESAPSSDDVREELAALRQLVVEQKAYIQVREHQIAWFNKQLFGEKSEERPVDNAHQPGLDLGEAAKPVAPEGEKTTITYERGTGKKSNVPMIV